MHVCPGFFQVWSLKKISESKSIYRKFKKFGWFMPYKGCNVLGAVDKA
jgi:hypothetical protein